MILVTKIPLAMSGVMEDYLLGNKSSIMKEEMLVNGPIKITIQSVSNEEFKCISDCK